MTASSGESRDAEPESRAEQEAEAPASDNPNTKPDTEPLEPSSGPLDTPTSGLADPMIGGVTRDSTPTGHIVDAEPDNDDEEHAPTQFAQDVYDDRQQDATREAVAERKRGEDSNG